MLLGLGLDPSEAGLTAPYEFDLSEVHSAQQFRRANGSTLLASQVVREIRSKEDLFALLGEEGVESYFEWGGVLEKNPVVLDAGDIQRIVELRRSRMSSGLLRALVKRLLALYEKTAAWNLTMDTIDKSRPYGWDVIFGDGLRLQGFECLVAIDPERGRALAWEVLYRDLNEEFPFPGNIGRNLLRVIPVLVENPPIAELWPIVDQHVRAMFPSDLSASLVEARLGQEGRAFDTPTRALIDLLFDHLDFPCERVSEASQKCLAEIIRFGAAEVVLNALPTTLSEGLISRLLMVLESVSTDSPDLASPFVSLVGAQLTSKHFGIRTMSRKIWSRLGGTAPPSSPKIDLPGVFHLSLRPADDEHDFEIPIGSEPLSDTDVASVGVRPWGADLRFVAVVAGLPFENVVQRAFELMKEIEPREKWSSGYEKQLISSLNGTHFRLPWRRPRTQVARRAIYHLLGELVDAQVLSTNSLIRLTPVLRSYDVDFVEKVPEVRPTEIHRMNGIEQHGAKSESWVQDLREGVQQCYTTSVDSFAVLAECSQLRCSTLAAASPSRDFESKEPHQLFGHLINSASEEYESMRDPDYPDALVLRNGAFSFDSPGAEWCALSPVLARACGWHRGPGLFEWLDQNEEFMVRSLWWVDGLTEYGPPHWTEVGEGWLVVGTKKAVETIRSVVGGLLRMVAVERQFRGSESRRQAGRFPRQKREFLRIPLRTN